MEFLQICSCNAKFNFQVSSSRRNGLLGMKLIEPMMCHRQTSGPDGRVCRTIVAKLRYYVLNIE